MKPDLSYLSDEALSSELQKQRADLDRLDYEIICGQGTDATIRMARQCRATIRCIEDERDRRTKGVTA